MSIERPNADIIRAYADGKDVEYRLCGHNVEWNTYGAPKTTSPRLGSLAYEWRIKLKVLYYRVALMKDGPNGMWVACQTKRYPDLKALPDLENNSDFVRWITDFEEVRVG